VCKRRRVYDADGAADICRSIVPGYLTANENSFSLPLHSPAPPPPSLSLSLSLPFGPLSPAIYRYHPSEAARLLLPSRALAPSLSVLPFPSPYPASLPFLRPSCSLPLAISLPPRVIIDLYPRASLSPCSPSSHAYVSFVSSFPAPCSLPLPTPPAPPRPAPPHRSLPPPTAVTILRRAR
jgi:hypothetical protein